MDKNQLLPILQDMSERRSALSFSYLTWSYHFAGVIGLFAGFGFTALSHVNHLYRFLAAEGFFAICIALLIIFSWNFHRLGLKQINGWITNLGDVIESGNEGQWKQLCASLETSPSASDGIIPMVFGFFFLGSILFVSSFLTNSPIICQAY